MKSHTPEIYIFGGNVKQLSIFYDTDELDNVHSLSFQATLPPKISPNACIIIFHEPPKFDAIQKMQLIKAEFQEHPVFIIGESTSKIDVIKAFRAGAANFLSFPIEINEVVQCLQDYLFKKNNQPEKKIFLDWLFPVKRWIKSFFQKWFSFYFNRKMASVVDRKLGITSITIPSLNEDNKSVSEEGIRAQFFGEFQILLNGKKVKIPGRKAKALLAYLLINSNKPLHREKLMAKFWPNSSGDSARNSLNVALHAIRKSLEKASYCRDYIVFSNDFYSFHSSLKIESDVTQFMALWKLGQQIERTQGIGLAETYYQKAVNLYRGDFLEGILDEEWAESERDSNREIYLMLLEQLSKYYYEQQNIAETVRISKKMLAMDNCLERGHRRLMLCYEKMNRRDMVVRQFMKCRKILMQELKIEPSTTTQEIFERMREQ